MGPDAGSGVGGPKGNRLIPAKDCTSVRARTARFEGNGFFDQRFCLARDGVATTRFSESFRRFSQTEREASIVNRSRRHMSCSICLLNQGSIEEEADVLQGSVPVMSISHTPHPLRGMRQSLTGAANTEIRDRIRARLDSQHMPGLRGVRVQVEEGVVVLKGTAPSFFARQVVHSCCRGVPGVTEVIDALEVSAVA